MRRTLNITDKIKSLRPGRALALSSYTPGALSDFDRRTQNLASGPGRPDFRSDYPIADMYTNYGADESGFVADAIFEDVGVEYQSGVFYVNSDSRKIADSTMRLLMTGDLDKFPTVTIASEQAGGWFIDAFGLAMEQGNFTSQYASESTRGLLMAERAELAALVARNRELWMLTAASNASSFSGYTTALSASERLDTVGGDSPLTTIRNYARQCMLDGGVRPNTMILGFEAYDVLIAHAAILAYTAQGDGEPVLDHARLEKLFNMKIIVSYGFYDVGSTATPMWPRASILLAYQRQYPARQLSGVDTSRTEGRSNGMPSRPQSCLVNHYLNGIGAGMISDQYDVDASKHSATRFEIYFAQDPVVARPRRGHLLTSVLN